MLIEKIVEQTWLKNWSGNWCLLFSSLYGEIYTEDLKRLVGEGLKSFLVTYENGVSSNYLDKEEIKSYGIFLAGLIENNSDLVELWVKNGKQAADKIFGLVARIQEKDKITSEDYYEIKALLKSFTPINFVIKKVADYLPNELAEKYVGIFSEFRIYTESIYNSVDSVFKIILRQTLGRDISVEVSSTLTREEFEVYISGGNLPEINSLEHRYKGFTIQYDENGRAILVDGEGHKLIADSMLEKLSGQQVAGTPAFKGFAIGLVRVVLNPSNAGTFEEGDILVTGMTRPEYLFLMKKAGAFITDAGGLLSHAAIVARELKKPCIVGTNIATRVLKDGMMVEVDADQGIVRIIKKE